MVEEGPIFYEIAATPGTSFVIAVCCAIWLYLLNKNVEDVGLIYSKVIIDKQYWRAITSSLSHLNILHLVFNMTSLWSCRIVEILYGTVFYIKYSLLLLLLSVCVVLVFYHFLIYKFNQERYLNLVAVGYSCVVFGWMTILSMVSAAQMLNLFGFQIPLTLAPFGSLIFTSLLIRNASFIGHLSGIIIGYLIAYTEHYNWVLFSNYMFYCTLFWVVTGFIASLKLNSSVAVPFIEVGDEIRSRGIMQNGILIRIDTP